MVIRAGIEWVVATRLTAVMASEPHTVPQRDDCDDDDDGIEPEQLTLHVYTHRRRE